MITLRNISFLKDFKYAHRGLHDLKFKAPENTKLAYLRAIEHNYAIELDLNITKDNEYVCFHDNNLERMCNINESLNNFTITELKEIKVKETNEYIPSFLEVLKLVDGKVPLLIEIKSHKGYKKHLFKLVKLLDNYKGDFAVFSFDYRIVKWFKKNRSNYIRGQIASYFLDNNKLPKILKYLNKILFFNKFTKPDFVSYNILNIPNKYITKAKSKGVLLFGYTAFSKEEYINSLKYLDNLVFEGFIL